MNKNFEPLPWDSEFFGVSIGRVQMKNASFDELCETVREADQSGTRCLYWLVDSADLLSSHNAAQCGFRLVDIRITFERRLDPAPAPSQSIRAMTPEDFPALAAIARDSHGNSRFFADGNFSAGRCEALYEEWLRKSRTVLVGDLEGEAAGYCTCDLRGDGTGSIGLIAVDPRFRRVSLGKSLVESALAFFRTSGMHTATVVTQGQNISSQRLYQRCGFVTKSIELWYHRWTPETGSL